MNKLLYFLAVIMMLSMTAMGAYIWQNEQEKAALRTEIESLSVQPIVIPSTIEHAPSETASSAAIELLAASGTISGSVSFPSEVIPSMEICAENITSNEKLCTTEILKDSSYTNGMGYKLEVPVGSYHVYSKLPNDAYKAYYNEFVTCGLQASCTSHEPIIVEVGLDQQITGIDPQDWYNQ